MQHDDKGGRFCEIKAWRLKQSVVTQLAVDCEAYVPDRSARSWATGRSFCEAATILNGTWAELGGRRARGGAAASNREQRHQAQSLAAEQFASHYPLYSFHHADARELRLLLAKSASTAGRVSGFVSSYASVAALTVGDGEGEEAVCPPQEMNASALTTMAVSRHVDFTV